MSMPSEKKQASPTTIAAMVGGTVIALSFTVYSIINATAPPAPQTAAVTPPAPAADTAAPTTEPTAPESAVASSAGVSSEAFLAADANPFGAIQKPTPPAPPVARRTDVASVAAPGPGAVPPLPRLGGGIVVPRGGSGVLPAPVAAPAAPELVGTLQGLSPSAVLRGDGRVAVVAVGETFRGWKVVRVESGVAVLRSTGQTLRLSTQGFGKSPGARSSGGGITAAVAPPAPLLDPPAPRVTRAPKAATGSLGRLLAARDGVRWADEDTTPEPLTDQETISAAPSRELPRRKVVFVDPAPAARPAPRLRTAALAAPKPRMAGLSDVVAPPAADPVLTPSKQAPAEPAADEPSLSPDSAVPPADGADDAASRLRKAAEGA